MKSLLLVSVLILGACQMDERAGNTAPAPPEDQKAVPKVEQELKQEMGSVATSRDGTRIGFEKTGSGPAVIVVSGALSHRGLYRDRSLPARLSEHFTVYLYDRRGRGESTDVQPYGVAREIEDIEALLDDAGGSGSLYGVSSGGALALQAAAKLGSAKVTRLAIYDAPYGQKPEDFARQKQRVNELVRTGEPGEAAAFFLSAIGTPPEALEAMKRSPEWEAIRKIDFTLAYDYMVLGDGDVPEEIVNAVRVPTLVMNGEKSMDFMGGAADRMAALVPQSQRKTLKGQAHQAETEVMAPVLVEFFTGSSTR
jgi:pimeloyl-ACP methyl ester carboxylesterase